MWCLVTWFRGGLDSVSLLLDLVLSVFSKLNSSVIIYICAGSCVKCELIQQLGEKWVDLNSEMASRVTTWSFEVPSSPTFCDSVNILCVVFATDVSYCVEKTVTASLWTWDEAGVLEATCLGVLQHVGLKWADFMPTCTLGCYPLGNGVRHCWHWFVSRDFIPIWSSEVPAVQMSLIVVLLPLTVSLSSVSLLRISCR